jgi:hypothetical protein
LSSQRDNEGIAKLITDGRISKQITTSTEVVILTSGTTPDSPAEFRFLDGPTTYWTLSKFVTYPIKSAASPIPTATPASTPIEEKYDDNGVIDQATPSQTPKHQNRPRSRGGSPFDDDNGQRIWHQVDGKWKWQPANKHRLEVRKALPPDQAPNGQSANP